MIADGILVVLIRSIPLVHPPSLEPVHLPVPFFVPNQQGGNND